MKRRLLLACTSLCLCTIAQAQIKKGSVLLGGNLSLSKHESKNGNNETKSNGFTVSPAIGLAVKDNWVVGIDADLSQYKSKPVSPTDKNDLKYYAAGIFARRYAPLGKSFYLYGNGTLNYSHLKRNEVYGTDYRRNTNSKGVAFTIMPGITYTVSKRFHLEASINDLLSLNYTKIQTENSSLAGTTQTEDKNFSFQTNFNNNAPLTIGFRLLLGK